MRDLEPGDMTAASALLGRVWDRQSGTPMDAALLVALRHSGNYVAGAFERGELVAVCAGFLSGPGGRSLHSHIAGVVPEATGRHRTGAKDSPA